MDNPNANPYPPSPDPVQEPAPAAPPGQPAKRLGSPADLVFVSLILIQWFVLAAPNSSAGEIQINPVVLIASLLIYYAALTALIYIFVHFWHKLRFTQALALHRISIEQTLLVLFGGILLALSIAAISSLFPPPEELPMEKLFSTRSNTLAVLGASLLIAPLAEELVFRGYIYSSLEGLWGKTPAVILSGVAFGAIHFPQLSGGYVQMAALTVVGIVFSAVRARTGNTTAAILMHLGYNATLSAGFLLSPEFQKLAFFLF